MIRNYNSFLINSLLFSLYSTSEGNIYGSTNFIMKFKEISKVKGKTGEIAMSILDLIQKEKYIKDSSIKQNYFDLIDKDDKVSFIQQNKIDDSEIDIDDYPSIPYTINGRNDMKIGKVLKYLLKFTNVSFKDKDIENFVNNFKAITPNTDLKFKLVTGSEIYNYYKYSNYYTKNGSLGSSCMAEEDSSTFKIYTENENVKLLVLLDDKDNVHGRAIVWFLDDSPCESKVFMDRVYTNRDSDVLKFKMYADENGWMSKVRNNGYIEDNVYFEYKGSEIFGSVSIKLNGDFNNYPFIDTMCFLDEDKKSLSNLSSVNSYFLHSLFRKCQHCINCNGACISREDCEDCDGNGISNSTQCINCEGSGLVTGDLCEDCSGGHKTLLKKGIKTDINKDFIN